MINCLGSASCALAVLASLVGCSNGNLSSKSATPKQVVPRPDGAPQAVVSASSQTQSKLDIVRWELYAPAPDANWKTYEMFVVGVNAGSQPTDKLRVVVHRTDDSNAWVAGDAFVDKAWKQLINVGQTKDRAEVPGGYITQRTHDLWQQSNVDFAAAKKEMEGLGKKSQSVPYGSCDPCTAWDMFGLYLASGATVAAGAVAVAACIVPEPAEPLACAGSIAATLFAGGFVVLSVNSIASCINSGLDETNCGLSGKVWNLTTCECECPEGKEPDGNGGCKQICPVCECNIVNLNGALTCARIYQQIAPSEKEPFDCKAKYPNDYPVEHVNALGRFCCPEFVIPTVNDVEPVCLDSRY
jgi:hypothetical protein